MTTDIAVKAIKGQPQDLGNTLLKGLGSAASAGLVSGLVQGTAAMGTARAMDYTTDFSGITDRGPLNPGIRDHATRVARYYRGGYRSIGTCRY